MISTHVLDIARGCPAVGVSVVLDFLQGDSWTRVAEGTTDDRGRLASLTPEGVLPTGSYRLTFAIGAYQRERGGPSFSSFFPEAQVVFDVHDPHEHVHVPLVISPYGYSTYRGT